MYLATYVLFGIALGVLALALWDRLQADAPFTMRGATAIRLPKALGWLGVVIGVVGLTSVVPPVNDASIAFGLLQIVWFLWLGVLLTRTKTTPALTASRLPSIDPRQVAQ